MTVPLETIGEKYDLSDDSNSTVVLSGFFDVAVQANLDQITKWIFANVNYQNLNLEEN